MKRGLRLTSFSNLESIELEMLVMTALLCLDE